MQQIAVVGAGYVGLCTAIAYAEFGHRVACVDTDANKVQQINQGRPPFYERGLGAQLKAIRRKGMILGTDDTPAAVRGAQTVFLCVGTPTRPDGSLDTSQVRSAASAIGEGLVAGREQLVVVKSTVLPGTTESTVIPLFEKKSGLQTSEYRVCVSPEFLQEGRALEDSLHPTHIIIGERDSASGNALQRLVARFHSPTVRTSLRTAEAIKYATNAFLATKVTFANEVANLCTRLGLDSDEVLRGMALDPRINPRFLVPGVGFGGSCLPKDLRAAIALARSVEYEPFLLSAVLALNERQPGEAVRLLEAELGSLRGKRIALLGLAFKAGTDDVRETRAAPIARELTKRGAIVVGYDPLGGPAFARLGEPVRIATSIPEALAGADGCIIQAAWPEIKRLGAKEFSRMKDPVVVDGRRTWTRARIPKGIRYRRIG